MNVKGTWNANFQVNTRNIPLANFANALLMMRECPSLAGAFAYDELHQHIVLRMPLPGVTSGEEFMQIGDAQFSRKATPFKQRPLLDSDVLAVTEFIQIEAIPSLGKVHVADAIDLVARENGFDPLQIYLGGLHWDGTRRVENWLSKYLGAADNEYSQKIGTMFLVSMIARAFQPGCKVDHMIILEGEQGTGKSSACSILGGEWFSDSLPDLSMGKEAAQHLRGKWLIEIPELSAFKRAEAAQLKSFCTRPTERFRPPYGRLETNEPRHCVFIGSTNEDAYLTDETGNRRFWPVLTGSIRLDELRQDRNQLFAEARTLYEGGVPWWPDRKFEQTTIRDEQDERLIVDAWIKPISEYIADKDNAELYDIGTLALGLTNALAGYERIRKVLKQLGWVQCKKGPKSRRAQWKRKGVKEV